MKTDLVFKDGTIRERDNTEKFIEVIMNAVILAVALFFIVVVFVQWPHFMHLFKFME